MKLKTFTAGTMPEALALVKAELGGRAIILHTRKYKRGGLLGLGARTVVEITAADESQVAPRPRPSREAQAARATQAAPPPPAAAAPAPQQPRRGEPEATAGDLIRRTYAAAKIELAREAVEREKAAPPIVAAAPAPPAAVPHEARIAVGADLLVEMRAMQRMVARVVRHQRIGGTAQGAAEGEPPAGAAAAMPGKLFDEYLALLKQEVAEELAEEVVEDVRAALSREQLEDAEAVRRALLDAIAALIPTDESAGQLDPTPDGRPRTIALIGPTGVGKTTTIAKLAATFKLKQKKSVGLITLDTYRIAAVEQLRTYANIIGLPLHVAMSPEELTAALRRCAGCDVVLIDTAGRSQRDDPRLGQLRAFIEAADPHEVHLVLSSTCTQSVLMDTVERFSAIRTDRIIFTKLDEAVSLGVLLNVSRKAKKRLSYVTTGQEVPHQIEPGRPQRLARLVMGGEAR